ELEERLAEVVRGLSGSETFALALLSGFGEELFFRGAVQDTFGLAAATVLFAALHPGPGRTFYLWMIFAALAGALFGALVLWRGNLLAAIVGHVTVNAVNLRQLAERKRLESADTGPAGNPEP
nr:CPBP family intramembrane metalloprotease [Thermoanaerobaculia bacterium]